MGAQETTQNHMLLTKSKETAYASDVIQMSWYKKNQKALIKIKYIKNWRINLGEVKKNGTKQAPVGKK